MSRVVRKVITEHERIRRSCGFGVVALARATGYSHTYVSFVEGGQTKPSPKYKQAAAKVLGVPEELIFGGPS